MLGTATGVDGCEDEGGGDDVELEHVLVPVLGKAGTLVEDDGDDDARVHARFPAAAVGSSAAFASAPVVFDVQQASSAVPCTMLLRRPPLSLHLHLHPRWHSHSLPRPEPSSLLSSLTWSSLCSLLTGFRVDDHDV